MRRRRKLAIIGICLGLLCLGGLVSCISLHAPATLARMPAPALDEISGMASSLRDPRILWAHNDSGDDAILYAFDKGTGQVRGKLRISDADAVDCEDMASFTLNGKACLLLADVGDNGARRKDLKLWVIEEPELSSLKPGEELKVTSAMTITLSFPDGPRDCEAMAVDPEEGRVFLVSKRTHPPVLYSVPLTPGTHVARRETEITSIEKPSLAAQAVPLPSMRFQDQPTSLSIQGNYAVLLTYGKPYLFERRAGSTWAQTLAGPAKALPSHHLPQAEAACFDREGRGILVSSEGRGEKLLYYRLR